jgi:hypothetical protein
LLCCYQKCDRINEPEQPQNDETRQPVRISACEKFVQKILVIHGGANRRKRRTLTIERPTSNQLQIGDIDCSGGESNSLTNPENFRGCSTAAKSEWQDGDSFSLLGIARCLALVSVSSTRAKLQLEIRRFVSSCAHDHDDVVRVERPNRASHRCSVDRMIHANYKPRHMQPARGENRTPDQGLMSPLLYR